MSIAVLIVTVTCVRVALLQPVTSLTDSAQALAEPTFVLVGAAEESPPVSASYHATDDPEGAVAVAVCGKPL